jgi:nucleotide-binding universal stress UspA family protein
MFQNILIPVDLSDHHGRTLEVASNLARQNSGNITFVHVIENIPGIEPEELRAFYAKLEKTAHRHLARLAGESLKRDLAVKTKVIFGKRAEAVVEYARECGADLIALTSHRNTAETGAASFYTLSYKIAFLAQCPVLLIK